MTIPGARAGQVSGPAKGVHIDTEPRYWDPFLPSCHGAQDQLGFMPIVSDPGFRCEFMRSWVCEEEKPHRTVSSKPPNPINWLRHRKPSYRSCRASVFYAVRGDIYDIVTYVWHISHISHCCILHFINTSNPIIKMLFE